MDADELTPLASWSDERIIAWARAHSLDRYPVAKVELQTTDEAAPDTAVIDFSVRQVNVRRVRLPTR